MGSEMCIRDRTTLLHHLLRSVDEDVRIGLVANAQGARGELLHCCLLYTSDAADERSSVDLGGRRIIKKKKKTEDSRQRQHI